MLTRTSRIVDIAPDASVFTRDPVTGRRRLEEIAFEVLSTQSIEDAGRKAAKLSRRGVRRVFGIDLARERLLEWSRELREEGREEGRAEGRAEAVLLVLSGRGLHPTEAQRSSIRAERDPSRLDRWLRASASVAAVATLFDE
jgi:hypothetical protein